MRRAFVLWLVLRVVMLVFGAGFGGLRFALTPFGFLGLTALTSGLMLLDARATGEDILTANAGVSRLHVVAAATAVVTALETIVYVALR